MAEYRTIRMTFWEDPFIEELTAEEKLLYLYLFTCTHTNNLGLIEISKKRISFESGLTVQAVEKSLKRLESSKKIFIDGQFIWLVKFIKHQTTTSPKIIAPLKIMLANVESEKIRHAICLQYPHIFECDDTNSIPNTNPIDTDNNGIDTVSEGYNNGTDTVSIPSGEYGIGIGIGNTLCVELQEATPPEDSIGSFPLVDGTEFHVGRSTADEFAKAYPAVDIQSAISKIRVWCLSNPRHRKTRNGAMKFLNGWLAKEQDKARITPSSSSNPFGKFAG